MATLRGEPVDRPAVSFMELNGLDEDIGNPDPFNIYFDPSWKELIELTRNSTDRIVMRTIPPRFEDKGTECDHQLVGVPLNPLDAISKTEVSYDANGSRLTKKTIKAGSRTLMSVNRQDKDIYSLWTLEHLLKSAEDVKALLTLDFTPPTGAPDVSVVLETEEALGNTGIVMIDTPDPLCLAASLFDMGTFTILAWSKPELFHELLARFAAYLHPFTEAVAKALPGRLWRIYGPEYASPPYLSPDHFKEYVVRYDQPMVAAIQQYGGFARLHSHGNLKNILDHIASMGVDALDPIEPPGQGGDVELGYVRKHYGKSMVLFGNLEAHDIEKLPTDRFALKVEAAIEQGTADSGRGFVLMPSSCPNGRILPPLALANYRKMVEIANA